MSHQKYRKQFSPFLDWYSSCFGKLMNKTKNFSLNARTTVFIIVLLAIALYFANLPKANAQTQFERIEMPVGHVFIPSVGYDDNDNVEIVFDGQFPNGCFNVSDYTASVDQNTKQIIPHLFATHRTDSICAVVPDPN